MLKAVKRFSFKEFSSVNTKLRLFCTTKENLEAKESNDDQHISKKRYAFIISYLGDNYRGVQM